jgi:hypothetical protein
MSIEQHFMIKTSLQINSVRNYRWHWALSNIKKYDFLKLNITLKKTLNEKKSYPKMYVTTNRSKVDT